MLCEKPRDLFDPWDANIYFYIFFNREYVQRDPRCVTISFFVLLHKQTRKAVHGQLVASGPLGIYQELPI